MVIRIIFISLLAITVAACDLFRADKCGTFSDSMTDDGDSPSLPFAPTTIYCGDVQNITQRQDDIETNTTTNNDNDGDDNPSVVVLITVSRTNSNGSTIYKIGPGSSFIRVSGSADTVWCKFGSNCMEDNRTGINVTNLLLSWISDEHAEFRRSSSVGSDVVFNVNGQVVRHSF